MISTVFVLWVFLANGNVVTRDYPTQADCEFTKRRLEVDAAQHGYARIERLVCYPDDARSWLPK